MEMRAFSLEIWFHKRDEWGAGAKPLAVAQSTFEEFELSYEYPLSSQ